MDLSRRHILAASLSAPFWAGVAAAQRDGTFRYLDPQTAGEIEALASQIIPTDETPGAREAGVIYFIDRALATFDRDKREVYRVGLSALHAKSPNVASLSPAQQIELLRSIEKTEFFDLLRYHTVLGFFGSPSYGGNRDKAGWKLIGFEDRMAFEPPFGYYDANRPL